jgi:hypothetical protein
MSTPQLTGTYPAGEWTPTNMVQVVIPTKMKPFLHPRSLRGSRVRVLVQTASSVFFLPFFKTFGQPSYPTGRTDAQRSSLTSSALSMSSSARPFSILSIFIYWE